MKKTIALFLAVALLGVGLIASCSDDPEPEKKPENKTEVVKFKVIFDSDGRPFKDGTTAVKVVDVEKDKTVGSNWPEIDDENIGTDTLQGWYDGDAQVTRSTKITKDLILKAKYEVALFTVDKGTRTAVHTNFVITTSQSGKHGAWNDANKEEGGNKFVILTGGIQYTYPVTVNFDYKDYDFIDVEYTASDVNNLTYKQYDSADNYNLTGSGISNTAVDEKKVITWEVRKSVATEAGGIGFAIQKYAAGDKVDDVIVPTPMTIQITKITFRQALRYTIKLDTDGGSALPDTYLVDGTTVSNHLPTNTTKAGKIFAGWLYKTTVGTHNEGTPVLGSDVVSSAYNGTTFKAYWLDAVTVSPINVSITNTDQLALYGGATAELLTGDKAGGYKVTSVNWEWKYVAFKLTLPAGVTLAHYNKISFTWKAIGGGGDNGPAYKNYFLAAAPDSGDGAFVNPGNNSYIGTKQVSIEKPQSGAAGADASMTLTINKPVASSLTGDIQVSIVILAPAGPGTGDGALPNVFEISGIKFE